MSVDQILMKQMFGGQLCDITTCKIKMEDFIAARLAIIEKAIDNMRKSNERQQQKTMREWTSLIKEIAVFPEDVKAVQEALSSSKKTRKRLPVQEMVKRLQGLPDHARYLLELLPAVVEYDSQEQLAKIEDLQEEAEILKECAKQLKKLHDRALNRHIVENLPLTEELENEDIEAEGEGGVDYTVDLYETEQKVLTDPETNPSRKRQLVQFLRDNVLENDPTRTNVLEAVYDAVKVGWSLPRPILNALDEDLAKSIMRKVAEKKEDLWVAHCCGDEPPPPFAKD